MILTNSVFDLVNNLSWFFILLELLRTQYHPIQATLISSVIYSSFSCLAINLIVKHINANDSTKKKIFKVLLLYSFQEFQKIETCC